jgi:hypothetical protein
LVKLYLGDCSAILLAALLAALLLALLAALLLALLAALSLPATVLIVLLVARRLMGLLVLAARVLGLVELVLFGIFHVETPWGNCRSGRSPSSALGDELIAEPVPTLVPGPTPGERGTRSGTAHGAIAMAARVWRTRRAFFALTCSAFRREFFTREDAERRALRIAAAKRMARSPFEIRLMSAR